MHVTRRRHWLLVAALVLFVLSIAGGLGAAPRYNRIVYGALPLALGLICVGVASRTGAPIGRRRWMATAAWVVALAVLCIWFRPSLLGATRPDPRIARAHVLLTLPADRLRTALFDELQPLELGNCRLERFGDPDDGGYLVCGDLLASVQSAYSYGIEGRDRWGCEVSRRVNVPLHEYDCFNLTRPPCSTPQTIFHEECIGPTRRTDEQARVFDSLERQFAVNGDGMNRVVVKMDVEGAEWETLLSTPTAVLQRIDQLVIELHGMGLPHHLQTVRRLKEVFYVANLHFNNVTCTERIDPFPATTYEVLFVNKRLGTPTGKPAARPHPLDAPNDAKRQDCQAPTSRWSHALPGLLRFGAQ